MNVLILLLNVAQLGAPASTACASAIAASAVVCIDVDTFVPRRDERESPAETPGEALEELDEDTEAEEEASNGLQVLFAAPSLNRSILPESRAFGRNCGFRKAHGLAAGAGRSLILNC